MPRKLPPIPLPSLREQLGVPEDVSDDVLAYLLYGPPQPPIPMEELLTPENAIRNWTPTAIRTAAGAEGAALAASTGILGLIAAFVAAKS